MLFLRVLGVGKSKSSGKSVSYEEDFLDCSSLPLCPHGILSCYKGTQAYLVLLHCRMLGLFIHSWRFVAALHRAAPFLIFPMALLFMSLCRTVVNISWNISFFSFATPYPLQLYICYGDVWSGIFDVTVVTLGILAVKYFYVRHIHCLLREIICPTLNRL